MEHIIVTKIGDYYRLKPEEGYILYNKVTNSYYSEAEVKNLSPWMAVAIN